MSKVRQQAHFAPFGHWIGFKIIRSSLDGAAGRLFSPPSQGTPTTASSSFDRSDRRMKLARSVKPRHSGGVNLLGTSLH
jgi:hypothetical protein